MPRHHQREDGETDDDQSRGRIDVNQLFKVQDKEAFHEVNESPEKIIHLCKLTQTTTKRGDTTSALAWGDLTGMSLDAGKVVEARNREVQYLKDKNVYDKIPRRTA